MKRDVIVEHLSQSLLFKDATASEITSFADVARVQVVAEGEYLYKKGEASEIFYVIAVGDVELVLDNDVGSTKIVGKIGPGGHFGETGLLTNSLRSLGVRAICDLVVICFDKRFFKRAFLTNHRIHSQLDSALAERLRVAFLDQIDASHSNRVSENISEADDVILFKDKNISAIHLRRLAKSRKTDIRESKTAKRTQAVIEEFASNKKPYFLTGESGTGKTIISRQIHLQSSRSTNHYVEVDLREYEPLQLERKLFGLEQNSFPFAEARLAGYFEQSSGGTIVFTHVHLLANALQKELVKIIKSSTYSHVCSKKQQAMQSRIVFVSSFSVDHLRTTGKLIPELISLVAEQEFEVPPLRNHKEDLPRLVSHYLNRFSKEYGKKIYKVSSETLGIFLNYDWPGNLTELSSVIRRAVMLAKDDEIDPEEVLLGLPKTEGKWEYNLLRIPWIRKVLSSWVFPRVPQFVIFCVLLITVLCLFKGPSSPTSNIGLTIGWYIGWPLMFFSFFFLARTWCGVCSFAAPGTLLQNFIKPTRKLPAFMVNYSGWIMAVLCILVFWIEIVWDAYNNRYLTGAIILIITFGSVLFSVLYSRRAWCRYLCPLGAVNAIFSMPSVMELRSNSHVCLNRCQSHACYHGDSEIPGCPMFRHPYLVDDNRDCIMCAKCIKACDNSSIQLNVRLAPQELWSLETPRKADSFLIVALGAIFFPFALQPQFKEIVEWCVGVLGDVHGLHMPSWIVASALFFTIIFVFQVGYYCMISIQSIYAKIDKDVLLPLLGYGFIPLILGGYMAQHLEFFISGAGRIIPNIQEFLGFAYSYEDIRLISSDSTYVLQFITVMGGLLAALYATYRVTERVLVGVPVTSKTLFLPFSFLCTLATMFVFMV
ncbi:sigma 54-interacting transcriptional regulator [Desulforhopalus sp. 52FAK]